MEEATPINTDGQEHRHAKKSAWWWRLLRRMGAVTLIVLGVLFLIHLIQLFVGDEPQRMVQLQDMSHSPWWSILRYGIYISCWLYFPRLLLRYGFSKAEAQGLRRPVLVSIVLCELLVLWNAISH